MRHEPATSRVEQQADGVRVVHLRRDGARWVVRGTLLAASAVVVGLGWLLASDGAADRRPVPPSVSPSPGAPPEASTPSAVAPAAASGPAADAADATVAAKPHATPRRRAEPAADPDAGKPELTIRDALPYLQGSREGIAVFPPPGTNPVRAGILVPDDFPLPEGYVRHYQTTDDGKQLGAILMFHPDYDWTDAQGRPIAIPADGIVPPELAPPGLPIRMLDVPAAPGADAGR